MGHAYYEFQHVELANVGSGKKRFALSTGGPSQGLFAEDVKMQPLAQTRTRNPPGGGSSNIFGPAEETTPTRPSRNRMNSSIPLGGDTVDSPPSSTASTPPHTPLKSDSTPPLDAGEPAVLCPLPDPGPRTMSPNPVTGQGYEPAEPKKTASTPPPPAAQSPRGRIPPGGFSSPLW